MAGGKVIPCGIGAIAHYNKQTSSLSSSNLTFSAISTRKSDHAICPVTGLTLREKTLLKSSWRKMCKGTPEEYQEFCIKLNFWLFDTSPNSQKAFKEIADLSKSDLEKDPYFLREIVPLIPHSLNNMLQSLCKPEILYFKMHNVIVSHIHRLGVDQCLDFFEPLVDGFPLFVIDCIKISSDSEECLLWSQFFNVFISLMAKEVESIKRTKRRGFSRACCEIL